MTGPEHYRAAETLIDQAFKHEDPEDRATALAEAQVHATLALAAATAAFLVPGQVGLIAEEYFKVGAW